MKASVERLGKLHGLVTEALIEAVQGEDSEEGRVPASAAVLAVAIGFLKANSITADAEKDPGLDRLRTTLAARRKKPLTLEDGEALAEGMRGSLQ